MTTMRWLLIAAAVSATLGSSAAIAEEAWEVERARAMARMGGPYNEYDAWLLDRWGCYSGSESDYCDYLKHKNKPRYRAQRRARR